MKSEIDVAKAVATIAHKGQFDKAGQQYIGHPRRVAERLTTQGENEYVIAAGWLHDVLEDTQLTRDDLHEAGVGWNVIDTVETLTRGGSETVEDYYERIVGRSFAVPVKLADIADNCDPQRLALLDDQTIARLTRKYAKARMLLGVS